MSGIEKLNTWDRKFHYFTIQSFGNVQPGGGVFVTLRCGGHCCRRESLVLSNELEPYGSFIGDDGRPKYVSVTLDELIAEAIRRWEAGEPGNA